MEEVVKRYWSSTEKEKDGFGAWHVFMADGYTYYSTKRFSLYVRAVSAF